MQDHSALSASAARRDPTQYAQRATFEKCAPLRKTIKQKSADHAALSCLGLARRSAGCNDRRGFGAATYKPCENKKSRKTGNCLGRQAPAGFLNVVVHDVMQDPFVRRTADFRLVANVCWIRFRGRLRNGKKWRKNGDRPTTATGRPLYITRNQRLTLSLRLTVAQRLCRNRGTVCHSIPRHDMLAFVR
ncbi:hypothetical protein [Aminobacter sp. HY435]|uniref:hypothetical protein n=1 Tax=Aminobacter sp. HY435 TaxID=2970917 RepID=UPI0022B9BD28|nr:hypothetical protein [Aminobacter sp. HY435]